MHLKKSLLSTGLALCLLLTLFNSVTAQSEPEDPTVVITFFWHTGCSYCAKEKPILEALASKYPQIDLQEIEVTESEGNLNYYYAMGEAVGFETGGVPITVIGERYWIGYSDDVGTDIENVVKDCIDSGCVNTSELFGIEYSDFSQPEEAAEEEIIKEQPTVAQPTDIAVVVEEAALEEETSSFPFWVVLIALIVVLVVVLVLFRKGNKEKPARKRH